MKKFTYTCIALAVMCSVSAYATDDDELELEMEDVGPTLVPGQPVQPTIPDSVINGEGKKLFKEGETLPTPVVKTEVLEKEPEEVVTEDNTPVESRITESNPPKPDMPLNITNKEISDAGKELKAEDGEPLLEIEDQVPEDKRFTAENPPPKDYQPNISDEEIKKEGKVLKTEKDPLPAPTVRTEEPEEVPDALETKDPIPEKDRFTEKKQPPKDYKPNISDEEIVESGKGSSFEVPLAKDSIISSTGAVVSSTILGSNVAIGNIGARLSGNRSGDNTSGSTASLGGMISPVVEKSGLWVNSKYAKMQRHSVKLKNWGMQIGYDHPFQMESAVLRLGVALDLEKGTGVKSATERLNNHQYGATLYGSYETENRHYVDFFLRTARSSAKWTDSSKFHNNSYTVALGYSKAIDVSNTLSLEPSAKLAYTHVSSINFVKNNYPVHLDPINIMVGNLGVKGTVNVNSKFSVNAKVELNKELLGKTKGRVGSTYFTEKPRAFWTTVGLGMKSQLSQNSSLYLDVDTNLGSGYKNTYQLNLGVNIKF